MNNRPEMPGFGGGAPGPAEFGEVPAPTPVPPTVQRLNERLERLRGRLVGPMPDMTGVIKHDGQEIDHSETLHHLDQAYLSPDVTGEKGVGKVEFELKTGWSLGREESQHGAFFGVVKVTPPGGGEPVETAVAVKEYPFTVASHAVQEQAMLQRLGKAGLPVVKPVGIIMNRWSMDPGVYVMTKMEPDLESLNAQDWSNLDPAEARDRVAPVTETLAMLHGEGVFPHEMAFGNVAVGEEEGSRYIFDLESAKSFRDVLANLGPDDPIPYELADAFRADFTPPRVSLRDFVYPNLPGHEQPATPEELFQFELNLIFEPYHMAIQKSRSPHKAQLERLYKNMIEGMRREAAQGDYGIIGSPGAAQSRQKR